MHQEYAVLCEEIPHPKCALNFSNPFELLVATVLGNAFGVPGFPVDTHVIRVTGRLRWRSDWASGSPDPKAIEREITACFPPEEWTDLSHRLILHGRAICHARKPDCLNCPLNDTCPSAFAA